MSWVQKIVDNFNDPPGTHLADHVPNVGTGAWIENIGGFDIDATANAVATMEIPGSIASNNEALANKQAAEITIPVGHLFSAIGVCLRITGSGATISGYFGVFRCSDGKFNIGLVTAGILSFPVDGNITPGSVPVGSVVRLEMDDDTLTLIVAGVEIAQLVDATFASGISGIFAYHQTEAVSLFRAYEEGVIPPPPSGPSEDNSVVVETGTGKIGPGLALDRTFGNVVSFTINPDHSVLEIVQDIKRIHVDITEATTITCVKTGATYTLTLSM